MSACRVRTALSADGPAIHALLRSERLPVEDLAQVDAGAFLVVADGDTLLGCVALEVHGAHALLRSLAVAAVRRGQGIGAALVDAAERRARAMGVSSLHLLTTTAADYFAARGYRNLARDGAPPAIAASAQFAALCPASASYLGKAL